jgi:hypothetical protein
MTTYQEAEEQSYPHLSEWLIRQQFCNSWIFRLSNLKIEFIVSVAFTYWVGGLILAALSGDLTQYLSNILAYVGPFWLALALLAFRWFSIQLPRTIATLYPAFEISPAEMCRVLLGASRYVYDMVIFGVSFAFILFFLRDLPNVWHESSQVEFISLWYQRRSSFLTLYFVSYQTFILAFIMGSGVTGVMASIKIFLSLLRYPLKLSYYRRLNDITTLNVGVGLWITLTFAQLMIVVGFIRSGEPIPIALSILAFICLALTIFAPLLPLHDTIQEAKDRQIRVYEDLSHGLSRLIEEHYEQLPGLLTDNIDKSKIEEYRSELGLLQTSKKDVESLVAEIENIPAWPIQWVNVVRIVIAGLSLPIASSISELIRQLISSLQMRG